MLTPADLVHLPCTPDLIDSGIAFACRSLALDRVGRGGSTLPQLRRTIASVAVELAFRRHLQQNSIRFSVLGSTPFTDPDRFDISLDGRRRELISYLISHPKQVSLLCGDPSLLLRAQALIPSDEFTADYHRADDLYLFAFLFSLELPGNPESLPACHSPYWIHPMPREWSRPARWFPFRSLALEIDSPASLTVEMGGQDGQRQLLTARVELPPQGAVALDPSFYTLAYVHALDHPGGRLTLRSPRLTPPHVIPPSGWANLWIEPRSILLAGWLSHEEFRHRGSLLNVGSTTLQFATTRVKNRAVPLTRLEPMSSLIKGNLTASS